MLFVSCVRLFFFILYLCSIEKELGLAIRKNQNARTCRQSLDADVAGYIFAIYKTA